MSNQIIQFCNCRLIRDHQLITEDLWVRNGRIINPESVFFDEKTCAHQQVDCLGAIIAPGFIDIQINGMFLPVLLLECICVYECVLFMCISYLYLVLFVCL